MTEAVRTQEQLHEDFLMVEWPRFIELFPGSPKFEGEGVFEQKAVQMVELALAAGCGMTGAKLSEDELALAARRPAKDFLIHVRSTYNRNNLLSQYRTTRDLYLLDKED
uniref:Uncharacterized protein n=1 Tax=Pseudomonas phage RVTF4 TaxID=3236931 RepID=A0AB39CCC7_9VIRU